MPAVDVVVAGAGPAGRALAAELAVRRLSVVLVDPRVPAPWRQTLCGWRDELLPAPGFDPERSVRHCHDGVVVRDAGGKERRLARPYVVLDAAGAIGVLRRRGPGVVEIAARVTAVRDGNGSVRVETDRSDTWSARLVVDATGFARRVSRLAGAPRTGGRVRLTQFAYGVVATMTPSPAPGGAAVLMDWTLPRDGQQHDETLPASFLYVLDLGDGTFLVEETILAGPRVPQVLPRLRKRLHRRLAAYGVTVLSEMGHEHVAIPMDTRPQRPIGPVLPFGTAGGLVHPASGYSVTSSYVLAPQVADVVARELRRGASGPTTARTAWQAQWPASRRLGQALLLTGLRAAPLDDGAATRRFFDAFFSLPQPTWSGYLRQPVYCTPVARAMTSLWRGLDRHDRAALIRPWLPW